MSVSMQRLRWRVSGMVAACGVAVALLPVPTWAEGFIVSRTHISVWLKNHPELKDKVNDPRVVKVTTMKEWLKEHPNVDPKNRPAFKPDEVVTMPMPMPLTPSLWPKYPPDMLSASLLILGLEPKEGVVWELDGITAKEIKVPAGKLKPGRKYYWQMGYVMKDGTIKDGGGRSSSRPSRRRPGAA